MKCKYFPFAQKIYIYVKRKKITCGCAQNENSFAHALEFINELQLKSKRGIQIYNF